MNVMVGNLFYGTEGWAAMATRASRRSRARATNWSWKSARRRGASADSTALHMQNFLAACRSRKLQRSSRRGRQRISERSSLPYRQYQLPCGPQAYPRRRTQVRQRCRGQQTTHKGLPQTIRRVNRRPMLPWVRGRSGPGPQLLTHAARSRFFRRYRTSAPRTC